MNEKVISSNVKVTKQLETCKTLDMNSLFILIHLADMRIYMWKIQIERDRNRAKSNANIDKCVLSANYSKPAQ